MKKTTSKLTKPSRKTSVQTLPTPFHTQGNYTDRLSQKIEDRIIMGKYPPGTRLDEQELANEFNVSRTPIRETLIHLASTGLIDIRPRKGATVPKLSSHELIEMFEVMAELEALCGRLAARRITSDELVALKQAHEACQEAKEKNLHDDYYALNEYFHQLIYQYSHNTFLMQQASNLHRRLSPYRRLQLRVRNRMQTSFDEHWAIVQAIEENKEELVVQLLRDHILVQGDRFSDLMAAIQQHANS